MRERERERERERACRDSIFSIVICIGNFQNFMVSHALTAGSQGVTFVFGFIGGHTVLTYAVGTRCLFLTYICG